MTATILPCPCPCPAALPTTQQSEQWTIDLPTFWLEPGDRITSPGGMFQHEILSYPFCQLFLDFRGEFEGVSWRRLLNEYWEDKEERAIAIAFLAFFRAGDRAFPPSRQRITHQVLFFVWWRLIRRGLLPASALPGALATTGRLLPHKDNQAWVQGAGGRWQPRAVFPATYWQRVVGIQNATAKPTTITPYYNFESVVRTGQQEAAA